MVLFNFSYSHNYLKAADPGLLRQHGFSIAQCM